MLQEQIEKERILESERKKAKRREYNKNNPDKVEQWKIRAYINFLKSRGFCVVKNDQAAQ